MLGLVMLLSAALSVPNGADRQFAGTELAKGVVTCLWPQEGMEVDAPPYAIKNTEDGNLRLTEVKKPEWTYFARTNSGLRAAVIVCPGGGYAHLSYTKEGTAVAAWLNRIGVSAFVLKYRCPGCPDLAFADLQRAVSLLRARAGEYAIDPGRIGVIGFSAGANLIARLSTKWRSRAYKPGDSADGFSCRPDFVIMAYPWKLVAAEPTDRVQPLVLRDLFAVDDETPPTFLVQAEDDWAQAENSLAYYAALKRAGVPSELHVYAHGGHGFGLNRQGLPIDEWPVAAERWIRRQLGDERNGGK